MTVPSRAPLFMLSLGVLLGVLLHQAGAAEQGGGGEEGSSYSYVLVGDTLHINCSSVGGDAPRLTFTRHNDLYNGSYSLPEDEVRVVSDSTVQLSHRVRGAQDGGQYRCWAESAQDSRLVRTHQVYVQYHLQKVSNWQCEVKNWDESLTCMWDYGVKYVNNSDTDDLPSPDVSVEVNLMVSRSLRGTRCSQAVSVYGGGSQCVWSGDQFRVASVYMLIVELTNSVTEQKNKSLHLIYTNSIVKPSPVNDIGVRNVTSGCVSLVWNHTRIHRRIVYRVNVTDGPSQLAGNRTAKLCGLLPYTSYRMSVQCRPLDIGGNHTGFWSDALSITVNTSQSVPSSSFEVHTGGYLLGPCKDGHRNVTILWKEVLPAERQGEIVGYQLTYNGTSVSVDVADPTWGVVPSVACDSNFPVSVYARTAVGASLSNAMLHIDTGDPEPVAELGVEEVGERGVRVVWANNTYTNTNTNTNASDSDQPQATVFWCPQHKDSFDSTCKVQAEIQWVNVSVSAGGVDIPQLTASSVEANAHDYLFGFSTPGRAIQWAQCYFRQEAPMTAPQVRVRAVEQQLDVEWTPQQCSDQYPIHTTLYRVHYCQQPLCSRDVKVMEVKGVERNFYRIRGQPGTQYNVSVQSEDFFGRLSPLSAPQIMAIPEAEASSPPWLWVLVSVLGLLCLLLLLWWGYRLHGKITNHKAKFAPYYRPKPDPSSDEGHSQDQATPGSSPTQFLFSNDQMEREAEDTSCITMLTNADGGEAEDTSCITMLTNADGGEQWWAGGGRVPHSMAPCVVPQPPLLVFPVLLDTDTRAPPDLGPSIIPLNVLDVPRSDQSMTRQDQPANLQTRNQPYTMARQTGSRSEDTPYTSQQDSVGIVTDCSDNLSDTPTPSDNSAYVSTPPVPTPYVSTPPVPTPYVSTPPVPTPTPPVPTPYVSTLPVPTPTPPVPTPYVSTLLVGRGDRGEEDSDSSFSSLGSDEVDLVGIGRVFVPT